MLHDIDAWQYATMHQNKLAFVPTAVSWVYPATAVLLARWARGLGPTKYSMLSAVLHMSLGNGRAACELPLSIFNNGNLQSDECPIFSGLGISLNSARRHIEVLCNENWLDIYRVVSAKKSGETSSRIAEINFKKLFSVRDIARAGIKLDTITPSQIGRGPYEYIHRYFVPSLSSLGLGKPNQLQSAGFAAPRQAEGNHSEGSSDMLAVAKKKRVTATHEESAAAAIATVQRRSQATRATRVKQATGRPAAQLTMLVLQAVLDKNMKEYLPRNPRVIVTKVEFGVLRKRLENAGEIDLDEFVSYVIRYWPTLAAQNQATYRKDPTRRERGSALPSSPNFGALAYKLPYFIAAYSNHLTDTSRPKDTTTATDRQLSYTQDRLKQAMAEIDELKRSRRPAISTMTEKYPLKELVQKNIDDSILTDDWEPPVWQERSETKKKA